MGSGYLCEDMFKLNIKKKTISSIDIDVLFNVHDSKIALSNLWHNTLSHVHYRRMHDMIKLELIPNIDGNNDMCKTCMVTKITRSSFPKVERNFKLLALIHFDVCDMHSTPSISRKKYFVTFIYDFSRYWYVYLLHAKDEVMEKFKIYKNEIELHCKLLIKCLRSDKRGEYYDLKYFESLVLFMRLPLHTHQNKMV